MWFGNRLLLAVLVLLASGLPQLPVRAGADGATTVAGGHADEVFVLADRDLDALRAGHVWAIVVTTNPFSVARVRSGAPSPFVPPHTGIVCVNTACAPLPLFSGGPLHYLVP